MSGPKYDPPRPLNEWEREMLEMFTAIPFDGHALLRQQIAFTRVEGECDCGCLTADLVVQPRSDYRLSDGYPSPIYELDGTDTDGMMMYAILFIRGGYLAMLEVLRADGSAFSAPPDPQRFLTIEENSRILAPT